MAPSVIPNGDITGTSPVTERLATVYSEVQNSRLDHALPLPSVLKNPFNIVDGPRSSAAGNPGQCHRHVCVCYIISRTHKFCILKITI